MENKLSSILTLIIILIVALTTYWLKLEVDKEQLLKSTSLEKGPDFFLKGYKTQQTLENGEINFILSGEKMDFHQISEENRARIIDWMVQVFRALKVSSHSTFF